jgi:twitching motility two-component system response regulator PilH
MKPVLLGGDGKSVRKYCRDVLQEETFRVILAADGLEALQTMRTATPDLVILDLCMPRMTGWRVLPRLKTINPNTPSRGGGRDAVIWWKVEVSQAE